MPGRTYQSSVDGYRYGFNGKEDDKAINPGGQDYGARNYDNRLGRFFSVDPFTKLVFNKTPYCFAGNSPIAFIDKNGGFQVPPSVTKNYPELNHIAIVISNAVNKDPTMNNALIKEFIVAAGLDANDPNSINEALRVLSYGSGPIIQVDPNLGFDAYGEFRPPTPDIIYISEAFADELKREVTTTRDGTKKPVYVNGANMLWMMLTFWHEGIHYEDLCSDGIMQPAIPKKDLRNPNARDPGQSGTEELFNCNQPADPNNLAQRLKDGRTTINIQNMTLSRYKLSQWFHDNNTRNTLTPNRLIPGPFVNPFPTNTSTGTQTGSTGSGASSAEDLGTGTYQNARFLD